MTDGIKECKTGTVQFSCWQLQNMLETLAHGGITEWGWPIHIQVIDGNTFIATFIKGIP